MIPLPPTIPFFIGTYGPGIYHAELDPRTGAITTPILAAEARDPSYLALSPDGARLYATLESSAEIAAFGVRGASLAPLDRRPSLGPAPCHVSVTPDGATVLVANYGGSLAGFGTRGETGLGTPHIAFRNAGTGPDPARQQGPHLHSIYPSPDGRFAYACDLGTDEVLVSRLDPPAPLVSGTLMSGNEPVPESPARGFAPQEPRAKVPPGSAPRHLAFGPGARFVYVLNEMALTVTAFARDAKTGALTRRETLPVLPPETSREGASGAEIALHPNGRLLYTSIRGADLIAAFRVARDGRLATIGAFPAGVEIPRGFAITPDGRWLLAAGQDSKNLRALKIDPRTGRLTAPAQPTPLAAKPVSIVFQR